MKKGIIVLLLLITGIAYGGQRSKKDRVMKDYVILARENVREDAGWNQVVEALRKLHQAEVFVYRESPAEALPELKRLRPRYVAIVERPEKIDMNFVIGIHVLSRQVTSGIYADFIWGIITGIDAKTALRQVRDSEKPLLIRNGLVVQPEFAELTDRDWDKFAYLGIATSGEKMKAEDTLALNRWDINRQFEVFDRLYREVEPDLLVSESYGSVGCFALPASASLCESIQAENGNFHYSAGTYEYKDERFIRHDTIRKPVDWSGNRKVYIACGVRGCDVVHPEKSIALAWMNTPCVTSMVGYPSEQVWLGQAAWGGLKFWVTTPGRYTMAEAYFLNQQNILYLLNEFSPKLLEMDYDHTWDMYADLSKMVNRIQETTGKEVTKRNIIGCWQERDLLAYFGDPKWDVRFRPGKETYKVHAVRKGKKYIITLVTGKNFSSDELEGDFLREHEHESMNAPASISKLPFSFIFPERLKNPRLAPRQEWKVGLSEDMLLVYDAWFEPGKTYKIVLLTD